jgi:hypothetical protein
VTDELGSEPRAADKLALPGDRRAGLRAAGLLRGINDLEECTVDDDEPARHLDVTNRKPPDRQTAIGRCDRRRHSERYVIVRRVEDADREGKFSEADFPLCADASEIPHGLKLIPSAKTPT